MTEENVLVRVTTVAAVTTVTLDSPANRNALSSTLVAQLGEAIARAGEDPDVRAVVLTHAGGTFCAGADLTEALSRGLSPAEATAHATESMAGLMRSFLELGKPVIAVADGHVRAGGFGLIGAADIALTGPGATFALTESRLGLAPAIISIPLLARMSARAAGRYFLTGEKFDGPAAQAMGLVTASCASAEALAAELESVLTGIRKASPQGLAASKRLTTEALLADFDALATRRGAESAALFSSDEAREGIMAFLQKRPPSWEVTGP